MRGLGTLILALGAAVCALQAQSASAIRFEAAPGPGFILHNSPTPEKYLAETMTGGLAVFDYNNDGRPDLLFANGAELPSFRKTSGAKPGSRSIWGISLP